ncbi:MAG: high frequency lysogenization protein HflD [Pseudomonadota bacterium]|nr:high frequency lysogenization protein HflD [Pseudomonadota bacterium]
MERQLQQTLALAGIAQAAFLVHQLAHHGVAAQDKLGTALNSLFVTHPKTAEEVFGNTDKLHLGLQVLQELLTGNSAVFTPSEVMRYMMALLYLQYKLAGKPRMLDDISKGIAAIDAQFPDGDYAGKPEAIRELSRLYQSTLSTLSFRIHVRGEVNHLKNDHTACRIRAVLFAGVRAAVLWRQVGGKRWHLIFQRKRIARDVMRLLHKLPG